MSLHAALICKKTQRQHRITILPLGCVWRFAALVPLCALACCFGKYHAPTQRTDQPWKRRRGSRHWAWSGCRRKQITHRYKNYSRDTAPRNRDSIHINRAFPFSYRVVFWKKRPITMARSKHSQSSLVPIRPSTHSQSSFNLIAATPYHVNISCWNMII